MRHSTLQGRGLLLASVLLSASLLLPPALASADAPCASLDNDTAAKYAELNEQMSAAYQAEKWSDTIRAILAMRELCADDPSLLYNLARAYHKAADCNKALFWYEKIQSLPGGGPNEALVADLKERAGLKVAELELECSTSALFAISCTDPEVWVQLGSEAARPCPYEERVNAGSYTLQARREGFETYETTVELVAGSNNRVAVPALKKLGASTPEAAQATLEVACPASVSRVVLSGPQGEEEVGCPFERVLPVGSYRLSSTDRSQEQSFTLAASESRQFDLQAWAAPVDVPSLGLVIGLRALPGTGLTAGTVYRDDLETKAGELSGGFVGTGLTFGLAPELGWAIDEDWMVGVQGRLELLKFAWLVSAIGRFSPAIAEGLRLRVSAGFGYGEILQPVIHAATDTTTWSKLGPLFGSLGAGIGWNFWGPMRLVFEAEARAALPDFALHFDWGGLGLELAF